jgi:ATP-dependent Clp protease ATP-binding subunit ClpC
VFERFTEHARQVVVLAQDEARGLRRNYIGTEHILLGLVDEDEGLGVRILLDLGADADLIRNEVTRRLSGTTGPQERRARQPEQEPFRNRPRRSGADAR